MQRRILAAAALASLVAASPIGAAQGATKSKAAVTQGVVFGAISSQGYPVVVELNNTAKKVVKATIGLELTCQTPGDITLPDVFKDLAISSAGKFASTFGPTRVAADAATGAPAADVTGAITGHLNKAHTRITGTWTQKVVVYDPADPTTTMVADTCDSGIVKYAAKQ